VPVLPPGSRIAGPWRVFAAREVVFVLDGPDNGFPDAGQLADVTHYETGLAVRFRKIFPEIHGASDAVSCRVRVQVVPSPSSRGGATVKRPSGREYLAAGI
jgi:hypothetical protein